MPSSAISGIRSFGNVPSRLWCSMMGSTRSPTNRRTESRTRISSSLKRPSISRKSTPSNFCMNPPRWRSLEAHEAPWRACLLRSEGGYRKVKAAGRGRGGLVRGRSRLCPVLPAGLSTRVTGEVAQVREEPFGGSGDRRVVAQVTVAAHGRPDGLGGVPPVDLEVLLQEIRAVRQEAELHRDVEGVELDGGDLHVHDHDG